MRIVVLGGGFGGVATIRHLEKVLRRRTDVELTLVSRENFLVVTPLLFEACSGRLELRHSAQPNRAALIRMVRSAGFHVERATRPYFVPTGPGHPQPPLRTLPPRLRTAHGREEIVAALAGVPHVAVLAR
jgi:hypothetical protein